MNFLEKLGLIFFILGCFLMLHMALKDNPYSVLANIMILPGMALFFFGDEIEKNYDKDKEDK